MQLERLRERARKGDAQSAYELGLALDRRSTKCPPEATRWFRKAAAQGHVEAQLELGRGLLHGWGARKDPREASRWFRAAAAEGNARAIFNLAYVHAFGLGL